MKPLDSLTFPLSGASLIEASAGTGKTYTIVNLYLRLLLGHKCQARTVEEILVLTFTNAATSELKERIRQRLQSAYFAFFTGSSEDDFVQQLIDDCDDMDGAMLRLSLAARQMDEASVFTIHGFCQRMLTEHAFESGAMYEQSMVLDESEWLQIATQDFWRKYIVTQEPQLAAQLLSLWSGPEELQNSLRPLLNRPVVVSDSTSVDDSKKVFNDLKCEVASAKRWWLENDVSKRLGNAKLKGNMRLGKPNTHVMMEQFCHTEELLPPLGKEGWSALAAEKLGKATSKASPDISDLDFTRFDALHELYELALKKINVAFSELALQVIKQNLSNNKNRENVIGPDDLLNGLCNALTHQASMHLSNAISTALPVALIDEFQDTDATQFTIFNRIYADANEHNGKCWIMIGDPKQAIYGFRGADIFTYIEAKQLIAPERQFTLATNWRSQPGLVHAINTVFERSEMGFMFNQSIPFHGVNAAKRENAVLLAGANLPSLNFEYLGLGDGKPVGWDAAKQNLSMHTANQIAGLLKQRALIGKDEVKAVDCCVLVRDRGEADVIKDALRRVGIASVFLIRRSVFASGTAQDLYLLLSALTYPNDEKHLRAAMASDLFCYTASELDGLFTDEVRWQHLVDQFFIWHREWQSHGLMKVMNQITLSFGLGKRLVSFFEDGARRLTDFRHLVELLQHQYASNSGQSQLLHWFAERMLEPEHDNESQQLRLETDDNLVQIVTLHASKGLEFPLVFIPFACRFRGSRLALFHDKSQQLRIDFSASETSQHEAEFERLAEDIRLLYVGLTRAVHFCSVGIWNNAHVRRKQISEFKQTALGKLLLKQNEEATDETIISALTDLQDHADVGVNRLALPILPKVLNKDNALEKLPLSLETLTRTIQKNWQVTSYSAISRQQTHTDLQDQPGMDEGIFLPKEALEATLNEKNQFSFEKGAKAGSFLHGILENVDLSNPVNLSEVITQQGQWYGIDSEWFDTVESWIKQVLAIAIYLPDPDQSFSLGQLTPKQIKVEMEFYVPLNQVQEADFNALINQFYPQYRREYQFDALNGMLKGFIDLTFCLNNQYFVADYKSNYLGDSPEQYAGDALHQAMQEHDYHLQGILYILALHRWLSSVLPDYQYEKHVGGAYYLFLRGMNSANAQQGVYFMRPDKALIEALDLLLRKGTDKKAQSKSEQGQLSLW